MSRRRRPTARQPTARRPTRANRPTRKAKPPRSKATHPPRLKRRRPRHQRKTRVRKAARQRGRPADLTARTDRRLQIERGEILRELAGEIGPAQREVDDRLQEPELVPRVVANALH